MQTHTHTKKRKKKEEVNQHNNASKIKDLICYFQSQISFKNHIHIQMKLPRAVIETFSTNSHI